MCVYSSKNGQEGRKSSADLIALGTSSGTGLLYRYIFKEAILS